MDKEIKEEFARLHKEILRSRKAGYAWAGITFLLGIIVGVILMMNVVDSLVALLIPR